MCLSKSGRAVARQPRCSTMQPSGHSWTSKGFFPRGEGNSGEIYFRQLETKRKTFFCTKELIGKCQISKSRGSWPSVSPSDVREVTDVSRRRYRWRTRQPALLRPKFLACRSDFDMLGWFWHAWVVLTCVSDFGTLENFWHARVILAERGRLHQRNGIVNFQHRNHRRYIGF